jgi:hypothetical protein
LIGSSDFGEIFFKMQVISVAFRLAMFGFWGWKSELLGTLEGAVIRYSSIFFLESN